MRDEMDLRDLECPDRDYDLLPDSDCDSPHHVSCEECRGDVCTDEACGCDWDKGIERSDGLAEHKATALCRVTARVAAVLRGTR